MSGVNGKWNRSTGIETTPKARNTKKLPLAKGVLAAFLVLAGAGVAWFFISQTTEQEDSSGKRKLQIKEVKPSIQREAEKVKSDASRPIEKKEAPLPPQRVGELRNGYRLLPDGTMHKVVGVITSGVTRVSLAERTFEDRCDVAIAELLTTEPGTTFVGDGMDYYKDFDKDFKKTLKTIIEIKPDDKEEVKLLKQDVIEARKELKARMDAGENVADIMREADRQVRELGLYRQELDKQVRDIMQEKQELSEKDMHDLIDAANQMLKDRGVKPLDFSAAYLRHRFKTNQKALKLKAIEQ